MALFIPAGLILLGAGLWLFRTYRDDRPAAPGFRDFKLGPRGLLAYGGIVLMALGAASFGVGVCLPAILR